MLVDGGDFVTRMLEREEPKAVLSWKEMSRLGYDAVTLGELELRSFALTESLMTVSPLPLVCTNVEHLVNGNWEPVGSKYRLLDVDGIRVGVVSMIPEDLANAMARDYEDRVRILPAMDELNKTVAMLRPQVDIIVLLAHMDGQALEQQASLMKDVDVVLGGHGTQDDRMPIQLGSVIVNRGGTRGQVVALTRLIVSPDGHIADFGGRNVTLEPSYKEDPQVLAQVEEVMQKTRVAAPQAATPAPGTPPASRLQPGQATPQLNQKE